MRATLCLLALSFVLAGCGVSVHSAPDTPKEKPDPANLVDVAVKREIGPDFCGVDFEDEKDRSQLSEVAAALGGDWMDDAAGTWMRHAPDGSLQDFKYGFAFDAAAKRFGPIEYIYGAKRDPKHPETTFDSKSEPSISMDHLRIGQSMPNRNNGRFLSSYDDATRTCWTAFVEFRGDRISMWKEVVTTTELYSVAGYFNAIYNSGRLYKRLSN